MALASGTLLSNKPRLAEWGPERTSKTRLKLTRTCPLPCMSDVLYTNTVNECDSLGRSGGQSFVAFSNDYFSPSIYITMSNTCLCASLH